MRKVWGYNPGSVKQDVESLTARHRCDVSGELCCPVAKPRTPRHTPHAWAYQSEHTEDLIFLPWGDSTLALFLFLLSFGDGSEAGRSPEVFD